MISFSCDNCNASLKAPDEYKGKRVRCSKCKTVVTIPSPPAREVIEVGCGDSCAEFDAALLELSRWEKQAPAIDEDDIE